MRLCRKYVLMCLKSQMQYRVSFFMIIIGQFIAAFTAFISINFMFTRFRSVEGFTYEQVLLCYAIVLLAFTPAEIAGSGFCRMPGMLNNGKFDRILVRPRNIILQLTLGDLDFSRFGLLIQALIVFFYAISSGVVIWTWDKILVLCLMIICGNAMFFALFSLNGTFAIFTIESEFMNIFTYGGRQFGRYPFSIYGKEILALLTYVIPMAWFQYYPLLYMFDIKANRMLIFSPLLSLLFLIPCYMFFLYGLRKYKSTGS